MNSNLIKKLENKSRQILNGLGTRKSCYICNKSFHSFVPYRIKSEESRVTPQLDMVGSDIKNFGCMYCGAHDRERHLCMYFDKLEVWDTMQDAAILHFAPEKKLKEEIMKRGPREYIKGDFYPKDDELKIDATQIPYENESFDFVIANHILEHIPDYEKALSEFYRVLKSGGQAIIQTPYSMLLKNNFEDENINTERLRFIFYGQEDHVRVFGEKQFFESIRDAGFKLEVIEHMKLFSNKLALRYGVNAKESFLKVVKE